MADHIQAPPTLIGPDLHLYQLELRVRLGERSPELSAIYQQHLCHVGGCVRYFLTIQTPTGFMTTGCRDRQISEVTYSALRNGAKLNLWAWTNDTRYSGWFDDGLGFTSGAPAGPVTLLPPISRWSIREDEGNPPKFLTEDFLPVCLYCLRGGVKPRYRLEPGGIVELDGHSK